MLFDLRSPGRRFAIRVLYGFLALLIGGGLVLFGVGGGSGSTGLLSQLAQQGNGSSSGVKIDETAMLKAQKAAKAAPGNAAAWDRYAAAAYTLAETQFVSSSTSTASEGYTSAGAKLLLTRLAPAWEHYISLNPPHPAPTLAADVANAFGLPPGIGSYPTAESAQEVLAESNPNSAGEYYTLAVDAYLAHEPTQGKLAGARATALAPKAERAQIVSKLKQAAAYGATSATGTTGGSG
jgi:hypothetical protein